VRLIGNSVCPDEAEDLVATNASDIIELYQRLAARSMFSAFPQAVCASTNGKHAPPLLLFLLETEDEAHPSGRAAPLKSQTLSPSGPLHDSMYYRSLFSVNSRPQCLQI
jgi:hypothetical protein